MLQIGSLVDGKYKILSKIRQGGMSVVYMAINEKANKTWAVKEVRKDGIKDFEIVKQGLVVEIDLLKKLSHPNLPSIVDVIEDDETFIIVMDYIEGKPLSKILEEYGSQPQEYVIEWAKQLCDVLGYLHTRTPPIIYRDLKPSNIMLKPDGNIMLIDFGTAREFKEKNVADTTCLGTIGYAAPEQFGGHGQTDARTDIYCLGATLYHLVTGVSPCEPPYEIRPIREIDPSLSTGLETIIKKCTQRNPADRYQSCAEVMYALEHYEEMDDNYIRKQRKKLLAFSVAAFLTIFFACSGFISYALAIQTERGSYLNTISEANKSSMVEKKIELFEKAISISPDKSDAYLGLIYCFKSTNDTFDLDEESILKKHLINNKTTLEKNQDVFAEICFEVGKLYWYYYDYGNTSDNKITRMITASNWFNDSLIYGGENFRHKEMATIYRDIGNFYRDIAISTIEASDRGMYIQFWNNLKELLSIIEENENEQEIVKLELYELIRGAVMQYATKFKLDGVTQEDMTGIMDRVSKGLRNIDVTTDKTSEMKQKTEELLEATYEAISLAFNN